MASRVGAPINVTFGASFTVPAGANAFIASGIWYDGANQAVTAVSGSRITTDNVAAVASSGAMGVYSVRGRVNSSGSDTWSITKAGFFSEGPTCQVQFYSVADNTNFVRQQQVVGDTSGAITRSVTSTTSDLVDAWIMSDGGGTVSGSISGFTAVGTEQTTNADKSRMFQANSPGASSTSITGPANSYPGLVLVSVYDSGGGGVSGSLSATESGSDTAAISGTVKVQGALSASEVGSDTSAIAGAVRVSGSLSVTESGSDTAAIVGGSVATGSLNATETGSDTAAVSGVVLVQGSLSTAEAGSDTASLAGVVVVAGSLAASESGSDTAAISGLVLVQGAMSVTEDGPDTFAATGSLSGGVNGSLNAQETGSDSFAAAGMVPVGGSLAAAEGGADSAAISGVVIVSGTLSASESGADQFDAEGTATSRTGSVDAVEQGSDTALILGDGVNLNPVRGGGSPRRKGYIVKGVKYWLTDDELARLLAQMLTEVKRTEVRRDTKKPKVLSHGTWARLQESMKALEAISTPESEDFDEDDEEALLLLM